MGPKKNEKDSERTKKKYLFEKPVRHILISHKWSEKIRWHLYLLVNLRINMLTACKLLTIAMTKYPAVR